MAEPVAQTNGIIQLVKERGREYLGVSMPVLMVCTVIGTLTAWYQQAQLNGALLSRIDKMEAIVAEQSARLRETEDATRQIPALATELSTTTRGVDRLLNLQLSRTQ